MSKRSKERPVPRKRPQVQLFRALIRAHTLMVDHHVRELKRVTGLSMSEMDMLAALGNTEGLRMNELARGMISSAPNVTRVARMLEQRGLVTRRRSEHSEREVVATLTSAGDRAFRRLFLPMADFTSEVVDVGLTEAEQRMVVQLLDKLTERWRSGGMVAMPDVEGGPES